MTYLLHTDTWIGLGIVILLGILCFASLSKKMRSNERLKYEFITIIAHKFRTPLTYVKWTSSELVNNEQDPYKKKNLQEIQQSNEKLIKLTSTLIELTDSDNQARSTYSYEKISACDFVRTVSNSYKELFHGKNIFFAVQCPPEDIKIKIDPARMEFVLQALLENALNYSSPGKNVDVAITRIGRKAVISVTDNGIGIDKKDMPHIFTKFYRARNAQATDTEGFGVGLYLSQAIVRRHKGSLQAYSEGLGKGTVIKITLRAER